MAKFTGESLLFAGLQRMQSYAANAQRALKHSKAPDAKKLATWATTGALLFTTYKMFSEGAARSYEPNIEFKENVECMHTNPALQQKFLQLQKYRDTHVYLFSTALTNVDRMLILQHVLKNKIAAPSVRDQTIAFSYMNVARKRLARFVDAVHKHLGERHAFLVSKIVERINIELDKTMQNIVVLCSKYDEDLLLRRAERDVQRANAARRKSKRESAR